MHTQRTIPIYFNINFKVEVAIATEHLKQFVSNPHDSNY